ncbi:MAG TPA: hypothetical protein VFO39_20260 [Candidatus Sulfotelmatobacter sp.]|nr:hypothetical protein [Candidatus Sulfotelmatobacter sp.]
MRKLPEVEEAKCLMNEAMDWSVFKWLFEKRRVRETADMANAALDRLSQTTKSRWSSDLKSAYKQIGSKKHAGTRRQDGEAEFEGISEIEVLVRKVKAADDAAHRARMKAEDTFDEAERLLNTELAREGCRQAIESWELHEKAIRAAESAGKVS